VTHTDPTGIVLDMEGVLHIGYQPVGGAVTAVTALRDQGRRLVILTNTTGKHRSVIADRLAAIGLSFAPDSIITAASATADYLRRRYPAAPVFLLAEPGARSEFDGIPLVDEPTAAAVVCLGGPDNTFTYERLQDAFRALLGGAVFVAMQRNRWWPTAAGPGLDAGAFVRGLEYAATRRARIIGKPSAEVYRTALRHLEVDAADAIMVGDDPISDLRTARRIGMGTCLVRTGKGASFTVAAGDVDYDLGALAALPARLAG
jgi:HAD superfamily hydrolase (TIGR01458 family)